MQQEVTSFSNGESQKKNTNWPKVLFVSLFSIFISFASVSPFILSGSVLKPQFQESVLLGESLFANRNYKEARIAYKKALDIAEHKNTSFLEIRYRMAIYLTRMDQLISQGESEEVKRLLEIGQKEAWSEEMLKIYFAHCQNFVQQIERLMQYRENIDKTIVSLKEKKGEEAESIIRNTIRFAKKNQTSLNPIKKALLGSLQEGNSESLLMVWQFQQDLGIERKEIQQALGKEEASFLNTAKKLLSTHNLKVTDILAQMLSLTDKISLSKEYFSSYAMLGSPEEQRERAKIALVLYPPLHQAYAHQARMAMADYKYQDAKENYDKSQKSYLAETMVCQGWCEMQRKNPVEAVNLWLKSLENWPDFPSSSLALGIFYFLLENTSQSRFYIEKSQEMGTSRESEIMKSLLDGKTEGIAQQIELVVPEYLQSYMKLCCAMDLFSSGKTKEAIVFNQQAKDIFIKQQVPHLETLVYEAIFQDGIAPSETIESLLKELLEYQDKQAALFYSLLYFKRKKNFDEHYEKLEKKWKELWQKTQPLSENKDGK